jgi:hypothetical protein
VAQNTSHAGATLRLLDPPPNCISLVDPQGTSPGAGLQLAAEAPGAVLVGFAAQYADRDATDRRWRQIGLVEGPRFQLQWNRTQDSCGNQNPRLWRRSCAWAGEATTDLVAAGNYASRPAPATAQITPNTLGGPDRKAARHAGYPG